MGVPFEQRWQRFDTAVRLIKGMLQPGPAGTAPTGRLLPPPWQSRGIPLWIGSWGSQAGLRRVACLGDGWLASAYNTTPEGFAAKLKVLGGELERHHRPPGDFPNALVTTWAWITGSRPDRLAAGSGKPVPRDVASWA